MQNVKDLIEKLHGYDSTLPVITPGYEELGICSIETAQVDIYCHKATKLNQYDRLDYREQNQSILSSPATINSAVLITFGDAVQLSMYIVKERRLSIVECPPWAEHDLDSGRIRLYASTEEAFLEAPHDVHLFIADDSGELDEAKLATYLLRNYPEYVEEFWVDVHAFSNLLDAHDFADAKSFPHGSKIEAIPFS